MPLAKGRTPPPRGKRPPPKQYTAMHRVADAAAPTLAAALQSSLHTVALQRVTLKALAAGFAAGNAADAIHAIPWGGLENDLYHRLYPVLLHLVTSAAQAMDALPFGAIGKAKPDPDVRATLAYAFDVTNPRAAEWARLTASNLALDLAAESQQAVRSMVVRMFEEGIPPIEAARRLRSAIGLNRQWTDALARYQHGLRTNAIPIPEDVQTKLIQRYADRALQHRAEVIARTESARAAVAGQQVLWRDQIDKGILDASRVRQVWLVTPDERLCFCADTPVLTPSGERPIQDLRAGDIVLTHRGPRPIRATMRQVTLRPIVRLTIQGRTVRVTADHPYLVREDGAFRWVEASALRRGDMVCQYAADGQLGAEQFHVPLLEPEDEPPAPLQPSVLADVPRFVAVPVGAVHLESDPMVGEQKIDGIAAHAGLLDERNAQSFELDADGRFQSVLAARTAIAGNGAELASRLGADAELGAALATIGEHGGASTSLGTVFSLTALATEALAAPTDNVGGAGESVTSGADGIAVSDSGGHGEGLGANRACLSDGSFGDARQVARATAEPTIGESLLAAHVRERRAALFAMYERSISARSHATIYSIEVSGARTFIAAGVLVHNCPLCASIPGSRNQPAVGDDFYVPYTGDTLSGPPAHPQCRCDVALLVANADGTWPAPPSLLEEILAYAGADGPPPGRTLAPAIPAAYR